MSDNGSVHDREERSPWVQPGFVAAGAVVALLVVLALILVVTDGSDDDPRPGTTTAAPAPPAPAGRDADASVCGLPAGDQTIPKTAPPARWVLRGTLAVPTAPATSGPRTAEGGIPSCFAHSPTGALFATTNIYAAFSVVSRQSHAKQVAALKAMAAPGPGRDVALSRRSGQRPSPGSSAGVQVAGFNVVRYEPSSTVVDLAFRVDRSGVSGFVHATSTLRWDQGDWKIVLAQDGRPFDSMQQIPTLGGYVPWSGV